MTDEAAKPKPKLAIVPPDALDLSDLWLDPGLGDGITDEVRHSIPFGKPRDYFRLHPDPAYRRKVEIYRHKTEDAIDEEYFVFAGNMQGTSKKRPLIPSLFASIATALRASGRCAYPRKESVITRLGCRRAPPPRLRLQIG